MKTSTAIFLVGITGGLALFFRSPQQAQPFPPPQQITLATKPRVVYVETSAPQATPILRKSHTAPDGTYFLRDYVSIPTSRGVIGWTPGQMVKLVGDAQPDPRMLNVTDGLYSAKVSRDLLTQDLTEAAAIQGFDAQQQDSLYQASAKTQNNLTAYQRQAEFSQAKRVESIEMRQIAASTIGRKWSALGDKSATNSDPWGRMGGGVPGLCNASTIYGW